MEIVAFERLTNEVFGWCSLSVLLSFLESEAFAVEALVLREVSLLILLSSVWTSDMFSHLTPKYLFLWRIPLGTNIPNRLTTHRLFYILLPLFDWSANQMH